MATHLPPHATVLAFEKQAQVLLEAVLAGGAGARAEVTAGHPRGAAALSGFAVSDARLVVARAWGAPSWPRLKRDLAVMARYSFHPPADPAADPPGPPVPADRLLRLGCLTWAGWRPEHAAAARAMLAADPGLARLSLHTAVAVGDLAAVRRFLADHPAAATTRGGPFGWEPLLTLCYSRIDAPGADPLGVAALLLAAGADPDAGFLGDGQAPPFTALTGVFGGEDQVRQPPHACALALARLLLAAGADPNDGRTLAHRRAAPDDAHLALLLSFGLGTSRPGPWYERLAGRLDAPARLVADELAFASTTRRVDRARLLRGAEGAP